MCWGSGGGVVVGWITVQWKKNLTTSAKLCFCRALTRRFVFFGWCAHVSRATPCSDSERNKACHLGALISVDEKAFPLLPVINNQQALH